MIHTSGNTYYPCSIEVGNPFNYYVRVIIPVTKRLNECLSIGRKHPLISGRRLMQQTNNLIEYKFATESGDVQFNWWGNE
jgi:hypothetical protein